MKLLLILTSLLLVLLLAGLWVGPGSYPERWRTQERSANQQSSNINRKIQIEKIRAELDDANSGNAAIEERARSELGMTAKGESFFEVILQPEMKTSGNLLEIKTKKSEKKDNNQKND